MTAPAAFAPPGRPVRHRQVPWLGVCLAATLVAVPGCGRQSTRHETASDGARLAIGIPSPDAPFAPLVFSLTRTRLLRMDHAGHERPDLIEGWEPSPDRLTWLLTLRDGVRFQDGRAVTAQDVAARVREAAASPDSGPGLWSVSSVDVVSPREVRLTLREPTSLLLESLSLVHDLPAGPYREAHPGADQPALEAVPQSSAMPSVTSVALRRYDTPRAAVAALLRSEIDVLYEVPNESRDLLATQDGVQVYPHVKPYVVTLGLNHRHPVLSRTRVRLAMNALVDRAALVEEAGGGEPAADVIWLQHWSRPHTADAEWLRADRDRANTLLEAEGFPARLSDDGAALPRFRITCLVLDDPTVVRVAGRLQQAYAEAGIMLELRSVPLRDLLPLLSSGTYEAFLSPMVSGYGLGVPYLYLGPHDRPRMIDLGYTAAAEEAERVRRAVNDDALVSAIGDLHRVLLEDPPAVHLYWQRTSRAVGPRVVVPADTEADVLGSLPRWKVVEDAR